MENLGALGKGADGEVSLVRENETNETYAMKPVKDADELETLRRLLKLGTPKHVLRVIRLIDNDAYALYEIAPYGSLESTVEREMGNWGKTRPLKMEHFKLVISQISDALRALISEVGIIHCDIHPGNILVCSPHLVKLGDFGRCILMGAKTEDHGYYYSCMQGLLQSGIRCMVKRVDEHMNDHELGRLNELIKRMYKKKNFLKGTELAGFTYLNVYTAIAVDKDIKPEPLPLDAPPATSGSSWAKRL